MNFKFSIVWFVWGSIVFMLSDLISSDRREYLLELTLRFYHFLYLFVFAFANLLINFIEEILKIATVGCEYLWRLCRRVSRSVSPSRVRIHLLPKKRMSEELLNFCVKDLKERSSLCCKMGCFNSCGTFNSVDEPQLCSLQGYSPYRTHVLQTMVHIEFVLRLAQVFRDVYPDFPLSDDWLSMHDHSKLSGYCVPGYVQVFALNLDKEEQTYRKMSFDYHSNAEAHHPAFWNKPGGSDKSKWPPGSKDEKDAMALVAYEVCVDGLSRSWEKHCGITYNELTDPKSESNNRWFKSWDDPIRGVCEIGINLRTVLGKFRNGLRNHKMFDMSPDDDFGLTGDLVQYRNIKSYNDRCLENKI